jgi:hypothetical protein
MHVIKGGLAPANSYVQGRLRDKGYRIHDEVLVQVSKPRNPKFHRLVHKFGELVAQNIEAFADIPAHQVLKRIQIEGNVACDEIALNFPNVGPCVYRVPQSLSFESMDDGEFHEVFHQFSRYIAKTYWQSLAPERIERLAEIMAESP